MSDIALALVVCFAPVLLVLGGIWLCDRFDWDPAGRLLDKARGDDGKD